MSRPVDFEKLNLEYQAKADLYKIALFKTQMRYSMSMSWVLGLQSMLLALSGVINRPTKEVLAIGRRKFHESMVKDQMTHQETMMQCYDMGVTNCYKLLLKHTDEASVVDAIEQLHLKAGEFARKLEMIVTGNRRRIYDSKA